MPNWSVCLSRAQKEGYSGKKAFGPARAILIWVNVC